MKLPPVLAEKAIPADGASKSERDRSFLIFAGVVLVAIALGFKSELLGPGQVWAIALGLVVVAAPALLGYLRGAEEFPRIEHYIPVALGATTLAGLSLLVPELWKYLVLTAMFGAAFIFALFVGQVVTFLAWAITALSLYLVVNEGTFAVMLLFAWYINRGLVRHTVEDSFTRHVILEYAAFAAILVYLFINSYQP